MDSMTVGAVANTVNAQNVDQQVQTTAAEAHGKLAKFESTRAVAQWHSPAPNATVFHYTTVDGLKGIVEENCLRASSAYFLNDSSEIDYGCRIVDGVLAERRSTNALSARAGQELREMFRDDRSRAGRIKIPYVKLVPTSGKLPIRCIRVGPSLDKTRSQAAIGMLLEANGFSGVDIYGSGIPVWL
jgi:hypothetical protein